MGSDSEAEEIRNHLEDDEVEQARIHQDQPKLNENNNNYSLNSKEIDLKNNHSNNLPVTTTNLANKSSSSSERVKVIVRCRPLSKREEHQGHCSVVNVSLDKNEIEVHRPNPSSVNLVHTKSNKIFTFDSVFDETVSQHELYEDAFRPIVESVLQGFNGTIFAYGQTGTGKTYTMEGIREFEEHHGVIPNAFKQIFQHIQGSPNQKYLVRASYLEIYQEEIRDLLYKNKTRHCELKESSSGVFVKDLSSYLCGNFKEINELMTRGNKNRSVGATNMNEHSSRSHAIFMITIEASEVWSDGRTHFRVGKLNLVDLAGSERQGKSGAEGERLKEAVKINLSLSALGNVIGALVDGKYNHIPYRDSKLTRLLQDSLGGNSKTIMVATIGPASFNYDETMTTLRYASRAKRIKNKPKVNEDPKDAMLREYQNEIAKLKAQLALRRDRLANSFSLDSSRPTTAASSTSSKKRRPGTSSSSSKLNKSANSIDDSQLLAPAGPPETNNISNELEVLLAAYGIQPQGLEPKQIVKLLEERRIELLRNNEMVKEEKDRLLQQLDKAKTKIQYSDTECTKLMEKIQWFESKVLNGGKDLLDYTNEQQKLLQMKQKELQEQNEKHEEIKKKIEEHDLSTTEINELLAKMEQDIENKELKTAKLCNKIERIREAGIKTQESQGEKRVEMEKCQMELQKEIQLKKMIIDNFIPPIARENIEQLICYNPQADNYYMLPFNSVQIPRPTIDRMILQPLLKRDDNIELKDIPNVYYTDENILQLQPIESKPDARIYIPPVLDPQISLLLKRAFADAEKDLTIDCSKFNGVGGGGQRMNHKKLLNRTRVGEPIRLSLNESIRPIISAQPITFNGTEVRDFIVVQPQSVNKQPRVNLKSAKAATSSVDAYALSGKRLQLRPGSAKGKLLTKF